MGIKAIIVVNIVRIFRHMLQNHIGEPLRISASQGYAGAGVILRQALAGGVFCRLQRMDGKYFSYVVQVGVGECHGVFA